MKTMRLNEDLLKTLKARYAQAVQAKLDSFKFQGEFIVTGYAKYLIEYAEDKLSA